MKEKTSTIPIRIYWTFSIYTLFFYKNVVFPAQADISVLELCTCSIAFRSRCHVKRHLAVLALKKAFRTEIAWWKRKYPILFQLCQGELSVITAVNSLLTSKGCLYIASVQTSPLPQKKSGEVSSPDFFWGRGDVCTQAICTW